MTRALLLAALAFGSLATPPVPLAAQAFEGVLRTRVRGMPPGAEMLSYLKGGKSRMEIVTPGRPQVVVIINPDAGEEYLLVPNQPIYMVMKLEALRRLVDSAIGKRAAPVRNPEGSMTRTGKRSRVAGHRCEIYRFRSDRSVVDMCLATGLGSLSTAGSFWSGAPAPGQASETPPWAEQLARKGAFALRVADTTGAVIWEVMALEKKRLDPALFAPPPGYRRMDLPGSGARRPVPPGH